MKKRIIVWFRTDLRLHDHEPLHTAWSENAEILPVYIFDLHFWGQTSLGFARTGSFRTQFLLESVADLAHNIKSIGSELVIRWGNTAQILQQIAQEWDASHLYFYDDLIYDENKITQRVKKALSYQSEKKIELNAFWGHTLVHPDNISFLVEQTPNAFTDFRKKVEKNTVYRPCLKNISNLKLCHNYTPNPLPSYEQLGIAKPDFDYRAVMQFQGGETQALERLRQYFWEGNHLKNYKNTRNGMLGANYSSKLSAYLAHGCISPRKIYAEIERYENEVARNDSTYWMVFELLWRDYFRFIAYKHGAKIFLKGGVSDFVIETEDNTYFFDLWRAGKTGYPLVDANMIELQQTGYMSNRGRQNVASFLTKNLNVNWQWGAQWFESLLIDYDPALNYGNWNYVSGTGFDTRGFRFFNITAQSRNYDPKGEYIKHWLPELKKIPANQIFEPWKIEPSELKKYGVELGKNYSKPMTDLFDSARRNEIVYKKALQNNDIKLGNSLIRKFVK